MSDIDLVPFTRSFPYDILHTLLAHFHHDTLRSISLCSRELRLEAAKYLWRAVRIPPNGEIRSLSDACEAIQADPLRAGHVRTLVYAQSKRTGGSLEDRYVPLVTDPVYNNAASLQDTLQTLHNLENLVLYSDTGSRGGSGVYPSSIVSLLNQPGAQWPFQLKSIDVHALIDLRRFFPLHYSIERLHVEPGIGRIYGLTPGNLNMSDTWLPNLCVISGDDTTIRDVAPGRPIVEIILVTPRSSQLLSLARDVPRLGIKCIGPGHKVTLRVRGDSLQETVEISE